MTRFVLLMSALALVACRNPGPSSTGSGPWAPTTHPFDPSCASCQELGSGELAHGGETRVLVDVQTDDPPAQWGGCMATVLKCAEAAREYSPCVQQSTCPEACKAEYVRVLGGATDFEAQVAGVEAVFFSDTGLCSYPDSPAVMP